MKSHGALVIRVARLLRTSVLVLPAVAGPLDAQCLPGEVAVRNNYTGRTVEEVEDALRADGDGLYVGVYENGATRSPAGDEWKRSIAANASGCSEGSCLQMGEFVGVVLTPAVIAEFTERFIGREGPGPGAVEPEASIWGYVIAGIVGAALGFLLGRAGRRGA